MSKRGIDISVLHSKLGSFLEIAPKWGLENVTFCAMKGSKMGFAYKTSYFMYKTIEIWPKIQFSNFDFDTPLEHCALSYHVEIM